MWRSLLDHIANRHAARHWSGRRHADHCSVYHFEWPTSTTKQLQEFERPSSCRCINGGLLMIVRSTGRVDAIVGRKRGKGKGPLHPKDSRALESALRSNSRTARPVTTSAESLPSRPVRPPGRPSPSLAFRACSPRNASGLARRAPCTNRSQTGPPLPTCDPSAGLAPEDPSHEAGPTRLISNSAYGPRRRHARAPPRGRKPPREPRTQVRSASTQRLADLRDSKSCGLGQRPPMRRILDISQ